MEAGKWWIKVTVIGLVSLFLVVLAVLNLRSAYALKNAAEFLMTFFSLSLLLMIGLVGLIHVTLQIYAYLKRREQ